MYRTRFFLFLASLCSCWGLLLSSDAARATVLFDQTWNGAMLFNDATVSFPTRATQLQGTELQFGRGSAQFEQFFELPLLPANTLSTAFPAVISIAFNLRRGSDDFDPFFLLNDGGTSYLGFETNNEGNGTGVIGKIVDADHNGVGESGMTTQLFTNAGFPPVQSQLIGSGTITLDNLATNVAVSFESMAGNGDNIPLNRLGPLSFSFWLDDIGETGGINSLSIRVEQIPEPTSIALVALGLLMVTVLGRAIR